MSVPAEEPLPPPLLAAWLRQSRDLLAVTDTAGIVRWRNDGFTQAIGLGISSPIDELASTSADGDATRAALRRALSEGALDDVDLELRAATDGARLRVRVRVACADGLLLWTFEDRASLEALAMQVRRQDELLRMVQTFGRLGVWEREIPSGIGRWDPQVFGFWGLDPAGVTPSHEQAVAQLHPDDRAPMTYLESTRAPGRHSQRFRVLRPDGTTRWIHSQWEIRTAADGTPERAIGIMVDDTVVYSSARALGEANAQLELALELGRIAFWRHDLATGLMHYNDRGYALLDIPVHADGLSLVEARSYIHADDLPMVLDAAERTLVSEQPIDVEARYRRLDGSWRYVLTRGVAQRDAAGRPLALIGVALDVSERVEHLRTAEELARRLDAATHAARVGVWSATLLESGGDWNSQMYELFDWPAGTRPPSLGEWLRNCIDPGDRGRVGRLTRDYVLHGSGPLEIELKTVRRDGTNRWIVLRADIDRPAADQRRLIGVALDVTEQHEALDALRRASERAALITRDAGIGTWEADLHGVTDRWDDQMFHLRGIPVSGGIPERAERMALIHHDDVHLVIGSQDAAAQAERPGAYEFRVRLPDGSYRWIASRSVIVRDERGRPLRRVGVNWDVTDVKNAALARQQAELAEREVLAKSKFLSRMSHELRTPLNAVLGFTQLLQIEAGRSTADGQSVKLHHIRLAGEHLLALINDVLDLSNLESGELRLQIQPVDLVWMIGETLPLVESLAAENDVAIRLETVPCTVLADPRRIRQVLLNLFSNAIKYNRRGGEALIRIGLDAGRALLTVRDTGRGLSAEQVTHLFEPFNRLGVESEGIEGTGIGLTIVKALVEGMGGAVSVTSRPGAGTAFEIALPAQSQGDAEAETPPLPIEIEPAATAHAAPGERNGQLLYIEDNAVNVMLVEELVRNVCGLQIASEATGSAGVARARELRPDVILVDLQLPDFDGFEVLRRLRAQRETASTPCIALSANAMPEDIARGIDAGFDDYWTKPIDFKQFISSLERLFPLATTTER